MKILCKKSKKDIGVILKKQKFFFGNQKETKASWACEWARAQARHRERACAHTASRRRGCGHTGTGARQADANRRTDAH